MYSESGMAMSSASVSCSAVFDFQLFASLGSFLTADARGGVINGSAVDWVKLDLAAVDATDCAIDGTVSCARRDDGRPVFCGTPDGPVTSVGSLTGIGAATAAGLTALVSFSGLTTGWAVVVAVLAAGDFGMETTAFNLDGLTEAGAFDAGGFGLADFVADLAATFLESITLACGFLAALGAALIGDLATGFTAGFAAVFAGFFTKLAGLVGLANGFPALALTAGLATGFAGGLATALPVDFTTCLDLTTLPLATTAFT